MMPPATQQHQHRNSQRAVRYVAGQYHSIPFAVAVSSQARPPPDGCQRVTACGLWLVGRPLRIPPVRSRIFAPEPSANWLFHQYPRQLGGFRPILLSCNVFRVLCRPVEIVCFFQTISPLKEKDRFVSILIRTPGPGGQRGTDRFPVMRFFPHNQSTSKHRFRAILGVGIAKWRQRVKWL